MNPSKVVERVSPGTIPPPVEEARLRRLAESLLAKTLKAGSGHPEVRDALLGGSFAKGTWLHGLADLDIFVRIDVGTPEQRFEDVGLAVGTEAMKGYPRGKKYAQHPYTEATVEGVRVNIVPCYAVREKEWKSAADRSPFHVELVRRLSQEQKTQVRLLKLLMKGVGVYGAEIEVQGFSGYAAEVLVMRHGNLLSVLKHFATTEFGTGGRLFSLPDPVDPTRDLAVAISGESLATMVLASREFLRKPAETYFTKIRGKPHAALNGRVMAVAFNHRPLSEDVLWGELRKTLKHLVRHIEGKGFRVARSMAASDNSTSSAFLLIPEFDELPRLEQRIGPTVDRRKDLDAFISTNTEKAELLWVDGDARARLLQRRDYTRLTDLLSDVAKGRAGSIGASKEVAAGMRRSAHVLQGVSLRSAASSSKWLRRGVKEIVSDALGTRES